MDANPEPRIHDSELDPPRFPRPSPPLLLPQDFQRLLGNPFLALLGLIAWAAALRQVLLARNLTLTLALFASLAGLVFLLQFHCLDCGATGWLFRWRIHTCDHVIARQRSGAVRSFRGPIPTTQVLLWFYLILCAAILAWITDPLSCWIFR